LIANRASQFRLEPSGPRFWRRHFAAAITIVSDIEAYHVGHVLQ